jgi:hypothetical protein
MPGHLLDAIVQNTESTNQRRSAWLPRRETMNRFALAAGGLAAIVLIAVIGIGLASGGRPFGPAAQPSPTPSPEPTAAPTTEPPQTPASTATPQVAVDGDLEAGTYSLQPLRATDPNGNPLSVTFTVPEGWAMVAGNAIYRDVPPNNMVIQFEDISSLNGNACEWSGTTDDVDAGTTVEDLSGALVELDAENAYEVSVSFINALGGYTGERVDIDFPAAIFEGDTSTAPGCDEDAYRLWSSAMHGEGPLYAQGPNNRWQTYILDVRGTRLVVVAMDFPETSEEDRAELEAILDSIVIQP